MDKKYQIFISSTYRDLVVEREKVRDVILEMYQFPIGMEMFSAADEEQWEIIKETIDSSDYYILIVGKRYGSVFEDGPDKGMSYTEKEYRYAQSIGIPTLVYIKDDGSITADKIEDDPKKLKRLKTFTDDVSKGREVKWFKTVDELGKEVSVSLYKEMKRKKRPGWIRSDSVDIEKSLSEIVELSQLNRELQEKNKRLAVELEKYKSSFERRPDLTITIEASKPDEKEECPELYDHNELMAVEDDVIHIKLQSISTNEQEAVYRPLKAEDIPDNVGRYVSSGDIRRYNEALPPKEEIEKYLRECEIYQRVKGNGIPLTFFVNNLGTAKATDISVSIEFPKEVLVFDIEKIKEMGEPTGPNLPENPIKRAYEKLERERALALDLKLPGKSNFEGFGITPDFSSLYHIPSVSANSIYESIEIEDNIVDIEIKNGLVHTKFTWFAGGYIVPTIPGTYEAKVICMCAEYTDPDEKTIKFIIEK